MGVARTKTPFDITKAMPHTNGLRQIEERTRDSISRNSGDATEDNHVHDDSEGGLDDEPDGAENGLLVLGGDVALNEHSAEIAVTPKFGKINSKEFVLRLDDGSPFVLRRDLSIYFRHISGIFCDGRGYCKGYPRMLLSIR